MLIIFAKLWQWTYRGLHVILFVKMHVLILKVFYLQVPYRSKLVNVKHIRFFKNLVQKECVHLHLSAPMTIVSNNLWSQYATYSMSCHSSCGWAPGEKEASQFSLWPEKVGLCDLVHSALSSATYIITLYTRSVRIASPPWCVCV